MTNYNKPQKNRTRKLKLIYKCNAEKKHYYTVATESIYTALYEGLLC